MTWLDQALPLCFRAEGLQRGSKLGGETLLWRTYFVIIARSALSAGGCMHTVSPLLIVGDSRVSREGFNLNNWSFFVKLLLRLFSHQLVARNVARCRSAGFENSGAVEYFRKKRK